MNELAGRIYEAVRDLPIIDYHNHLSCADLRQNRKFENITRLWLTPDPYKHRLMRILGVPEKYITGDASDYEKFAAWCKIFPDLAGNAVYDWSRIELKTVFGIETPICAENTDTLWNALNEKLALPEFSAMSILNRFGIEYCAPCATLTEELSFYEQSDRFAPSLRGDDIVAPTAELLARLAVQTGRTIADLASYTAAINARLSVFHQAGCRFSDHALDDGFAFALGDAEAAFAKVLAGESLTAQESAVLRTEILIRLGVCYEAFGWTMQLHIGALRRTSDRLKLQCGPAGGYAGIGSTLDISAVVQLLNAIEQRKALPKVILFTLNPSDNAALAILSGSFSKDGVPAIVSQGPAWWWCDHRQGIREVLEHISVYSVLPAFVGMTTDSRSILSFVRHDYFRRILCEWLAQKAEKGELPNDAEALCRIAVKMCYENAKQCVK